MGAFVTFDEDFLLTYFHPSLMARGVTDTTGTTSARDYLQYAKEDLKGEDGRALINAFGNAKRSIHRLVDDLIFQYGLADYCRRSDFPRKLAILAELDVLSPYVLTSLNVERNTVEHDYVTPTLTRTREAVDVAELLIMATSGFYTGVPYEGFCGWREGSRHLLLRLNPWSCCLTLHKYVRPKGARTRSYEGTRYFTAQVRDMNYRYRLEVAESPWKVIPIDKAGKGCWVPILRELISIQKTSRFDISSVTMTMALDEQRFKEIFADARSDGRQVERLEEAQGFESLS